MKTIIRGISLLTIAVLLALGGTSLVRAEDTQSETEHAQEQQQEAQKKEAERVREDAKRAAEQRREAAKKKAEAEHATEVKNESEDTEHDGQSTVTELRKAAREHSQEERTKNCEERKAGLVQKLTELKKNAASYKAKIDNVYSAAQTFMTSNNLSSSTLDTQLVAADAAQADATVQVEALATLTVTIDCTNPSVAAQIASFKVAAEKARTSLHTYKKAVQAVLTTLNTLKEAADA